MNKLAIFAFAACLSLMLGSFTHEAQSSSTNQALGIFYSEPCVQDYLQDLRSQGIQPSISTSVLPDSGGTLVQVFIAWCPACVDDPIPCAAPCFATGVLVDVVNREVLSCP